MNKERKEKLKRFGKKMGRGLLKGSKAVGRGFVKGGKAVGRGIGRYAKEKVKKYEEDRKAYGEAYRKAEIKALKSKARKDARAKILQKPKKERKSTGLDLGFGGITPPDVSLGFGSRSKKRKKKRRSGIRPIRMI